MASSNPGDPRRSDKPKMQTLPEMTKYEYARVLGARALQISKGSPVMVELHGQTDPLEMAKMEMRQKKLPLRVSRQLQGGLSEFWPVSDMIPPARLWADTD